MRVGLMVVAGWLLAGCAVASTPSAELTLTAEGGALAPARVTAAPGQTVRLALDNQDDVAHQLAIDEIALATSGGSSGAMAGMDHDMPGMEMDAMPPVHMMAPAGTRQMVEFTPVQEGEYTIRCLETGHTETAVLQVRR